MKHPEYANTGWTGVSTGAGTWSTDGFGHGTHVAGTLAARGNGFGVVGVAPLANVVMFKIFDSSGTYAYASSVGNAALECKKRGAKVVSMSLGGLGSSQAENDIFASLLKNGVVSVAGTCYTAKVWHASCAVPSCAYTSRKLSTLIFLGDVI
jgi:serine protease